MGLIAPEDDEEMAATVPLRDFSSINQQIELFLADYGKTTMSLPPCNKHVRAQIHLLASASVSILVSVVRGHD